jgi:hypothetical protein
MGQDTRWGPVMNLAAFPKHPLEISEKTGTRRSILFLILAALFFAGCSLIFALALAPGILEDAQLAKEGAPALNGIVSGDLHSHLFTNWGDLKLEYTVRAEGGDTTSFERNKDIFFVGNLDDSKEPVIYYLKADPKVATVSYALDLLLNREISLAVALLFTLVAVFAAIWACMRTLKLRRRLRAAADHPEPVEVTVTCRRFTRGKQYISYRWGHRKNQQAVAIWKKIDEPLFTNQTGDRALAVKGVDGFAHLMDVDFRPFVLTEEEKAAVRG